MTTPSPEGDGPLAANLWADKNGFKKGLQLDRIDNDGNYEPTNCRFVTNRENSLNKTQLRSDNKTGFIGVRKIKDRYQSIVGRLGIHHNVGMFDTMIEAALARDLYIMTNFPEDGYPLNFDFREEKYRIKE